MNNGCFSHVQMFRTKSATMKKFFLLLTLFAYAVIACAQRSSFGLKAGGNFYIIQLNAEE
jgi:hypothetical protein